MTISSINKPFRFLDLPAEIREQVRNVQEQLARPHLSAPSKPRSRLCYDTNKF